MISDVLWEAVEGIDRYLREPTFNGCYNGELRARIVLLREEMDMLRRELDTPPDGFGIPSSPLDDPDLEA